MNGALSRTPALLTRMSTVPILRTSAPMSRGSVTSQMSKLAPVSRATRSRSLGVREVRKRRGAFRGEAAGDGLADAAAAAGDQRDSVFHFRNGIPRIIELRTVKIAAKTDPGYPAGTWPKCSPRSWTCARSRLRRRP